MPRASRHFLPGYVWHITHRCHQRKFLLKFARDRRRYLYWLFEAKKRYGLSVLNYVVTSNHVHLMVKDTGANVIAESMQLIAGRTAQEYNQRKGRRGAFWEDRYHATAIEADVHLHRCLVYIDLNMVRAGVVNHPGEWNESGFSGIQKPPKRYAIIDLQSLIELSGFADLRDFQTAHRQWVEQGLENGLLMRDDRWSESIAVGSLAFIDQVKNELGFKADHRDVIESDGSYVLREPAEAYALKFACGNEALRSQNTFFWNEIVDEATI
jgi:REP element-mobilizing transposase RayT